MDASIKSCGGCKGGLMNCGDGKIYRPSNVFFLELFDVLMVFGSMLMFLSILVWLIVKGIKETLAASDKDNLNEAENTTIAFIILGAIILFIGIVSYIYHYTIRKQK